MIKMILAKKTFSIKTKMINLLRWQSIKRVVIRIKKKIEAKKSLMNFQITEKLKGAIINEDNFDMNDINIRG